MTTAGRHRVPRSALATLPWLVALFSFVPAASALPDDAAARALAIRACEARFASGTFRPDTDAFVAMRLDHARGLWCVSVEQRWNGRPVLGAEQRVTIDESGRIVFVSGSACPAPRPGMPPALDRRGIAGRARLAADRDGDEPESLEPVLVVRSGAARHAWRVRWATLAPPRPRAVVIDAVTGDVLEREGEPMPSIGLVYPRDGRDALVEVELPGLSGDGTRLVGPRLDVQQAGLGQLTAPGGDFRILPTDPDTTRFDDVAVWWREQQFLAWLRSRGYAGFPDTLHVRVHAPTAPTLANTVENYVMLGEAYPGYTRDPSKGTDILVHETQHAVSWGFGLLHGGPEVDALNEGLSDYMAAAFTNDPVIGEWEYIGFPGGATSLATDPGVWRYGRFNAVGYGAATSGTTWANGMIFSGALWDLRTAIGPAADSLVLESLRLVSPTPTFAMFADAMVAADAALHGGRFLGDIRNAFGRREIAGSSDAGIAGPAVLNGGEPGAFTATGGVLSDPSHSVWSIRHEMNGVPVDSLVGIGSGASFAWTDTVDFVAIARIPTAWAGASVTRSLRVAVAPTSVSITGSGTRYESQPDTLSLLPDSRIVRDSTVWIALRSCGPNCTRLDTVGIGTTVVLTDTASYQLLVRTRSIWGTVLTTSFNVSVVPVTLWVTGPARLSATEPGTYQLAPNPNLAGPATWYVGPHCAGTLCPEPESLGTGATFVHAGDASFRVRVTARSVWGRRTSLDLHTIVIPLSLTLTGPSALAPRQSGHYAAVYDSRFTSSGPTWWVQRWRDGAPFGAADSIGRAWGMDHADTLDFTATAVGRTHWGVLVRDSVRVLVQRPVVAIRGPAWWDGGPSPLRFVVDVGMRGPWTVRWSISPVPRHGTSPYFPGADTLDWSAASTFDIGVSVTDAEGHVGAAERRVWRPALRLAVPAAVVADEPVSCRVTPDTLCGDMIATWESAPAGEPGPLAWSAAGEGFAWVTSSARDRWVRARVSGGGFTVVSDSQLVTIAPPRVSLRAWSGVAGDGLAVRASATGAGPIQFAWTVHAPGGPARALGALANGSVVVPDTPPFVVTATATDGNGRIGADSIAVAADGSLVGGDSSGLGFACAAVASGDLALLVWGPADAGARLRVFDTAGRVVADWLEGGYAGGTRLLTRSTAGLRSGVYFCRFSAGAAQQVRRIVVVH